MWVERKHLSWIGSVPGLGYNSPALKRNDRWPLFSSNHQKYCYFLFYPRTSTAENWFHAEWEQCWFLSHHHALGFSWKPASWEAARADLPQPEWKWEKHWLFKGIFGHCVDQMFPVGRKLRENMLLLSIHLGELSLSSNNAWRNKSMYNNIRDIYKYI